MKNLLNMILLATLTGVCQFALAGSVQVASLTVNVATLKDNIAFAKCSKIIVLPPDSDVIAIYDDGTFTETVTANASTGYLYGTWASIDGDRLSKFRFNYTGNPGERTGSWGDYVSNIETVAGAACGNTTVNAFGGTLRFIRGDITVKTPEPGVGTGTAAVSFQTEMYGYDVDFGMYGRGTETRSVSGTFVWY